MYYKLLIIITLISSTAFGQTADSLKTLKEVAITANKTFIQQKPDRIIYNLQADPDSKGNSVLGMMRKIPFITLDGNENILLKGNASYKVLINGKSSSMVSGNLTMILKSMPASTISRIEVITIPPAKYDAEGLAGIINIITNKKVNEGYNGTLNANEGFPSGGPRAGGSFTAKLGKLGVSAFGGVNHYNNPRTSFSNNRTGTDTTTLQQNGLATSSNTGGYFGTQLSYEIDSLNLLSAQVNVNGIRTKGNSSLLSVAPAQQYDLLNRNSSHSYGIDAAINYQLGFKASKSRFLTFSYMYSTNRGNLHADIDISTMPDYKQDAHISFNEHTLQMDFVTTVKKLNIEAGVKGILRKNFSDFKYLDDKSEVNASLSNLYTNTQNVFSAYNSYQLSLKSWNISAGLRLEQTVIKADFISSDTTANQNYLNVIPSIAIGKKFNDQSSINFGFSQRIRRPGINRLNPIVDRSNPNIESSGNPYLRPVLLNDIQAGYSSNKKLSLNIGLDYSFMNNLDLKVVNFDPATKITRTYYANVGKAKSLGTNFNIGYPITKWYNTGLNGNVMYLWLGDGMGITNNCWIYSLALSNAFQLNKGWRINADLNVISRSPNGLQGTSNGMISTAFGVTKELVKNKLSIAGSIKNPFTKYRDNQNQTFGPGFQQFSISRDYFRSFNISLNYNFGGLREGINKSRNEIKNDDLSN